MKPTNQTVAFSWEEWEAVREWVKRVRGRTFGSYVRELVRSDMNVIQTDDVPIKSTTSDRQKTAVSDTDGIAPEPLEWSRIVAVAGQSPNEMHRAIYRHCRHLMESIAIVAAKELGLDTHEIPIRFRGNGTLQRPVADGGSPLSDEERRERVRIANSGDERPSDTAFGGHAAKASRKRA